MEPVRADKIEIDSGTFCRLLSPSSTPDTKRTYTTLHVHIFGGQLCDSFWHSLHHA